MIGGLLGSVAGIIQAIMGQSAQQDAIQLGRENLDFQKDNAKQQFDLATASRPDAFGNETRYDSLRDEWILDMTPVQQALADAFEHEQYAGLREDAPRARGLRRRQDERSQQAFKDYDKARSDYLYSPEQPDSEASYVDDAMQAAALADNQVRQGRKGDLRTAAIRMGQGDDLGQIIDTINRGDRDANVGNILKAKSAGREAFGTATNNWEAKNQGRMGFFGKVSDDVGQAPPVDFDTPDRMDATTRSMLQAIGAALGNASSGVGGAYGDLATLTAGGAPDLSGIIRGLSGLKFGGDNPSFNAPVVDPYSVGGNRTGSGVAKNNWLTMWDKPPSTGSVPWYSRGIF